MTRNWRDIWGRDYATAFTVAGSVSDARLLAVRQVLLHALKTGASLDETRTELRVTSRFMLQMEADLAEDRELAASFEEARAELRRRGLV